MTKIPLQCYLTSLTLSLLTLPCFFFPAAELADRARCAVLLLPCTPALAQHPHATRASMLGPRRCGQRARARARHRARRLRAAVSAATTGGGKRDDGGAGRIEAEPNSPPSGAVLAAEAARRGKREGSGRRRRKSREEEGDPAPRPRLHPALRPPWPTREGTGRMEGNPAAAAHESGA